MANNDTPKQNQTKSQPSIVKYADLGSPMFPIMGVSFLLCFQKINCNYNLFSLFADTFVCDEDGFFPDQSDCVYFYECHKGRPMKIRCNKGLAYRRDIQTCDLMDNVAFCQKDIQTGLEEHTTHQHLNDREEESVLSNILPDLDKSMYNPIEKDVSQDHGVTEMVDRRGMERNEALMEKYKMFPQIGSRPPYRDMHTGLNNCTST